MTADPAILDRFRTLLREHDRRTIERCAAVAQEEAHRWEGAALTERIDEETEKWARSRAATSRDIEARIRALAEGGEHG